MSYSFNGATKQITLVGVTSLSLPDVYSRYKEWILAGNASSLAAFVTVGGDIPAIPLYLFLLNGWRIVPMSADHTLTVVDGILEVSGGGDPFVDPAGNYAIRINRQVPGIAIGYSTSGVAAPTADQNAAAVWAHSSAAQVITRLAELWARNDLDPSKPVTVGQTQISFGDIVIALTGDGVTTSHTQRQ